MKRTDRRPPRRGGRTPATSASAATAPRRRRRPLTVLLIVLAAIAVEAALGTWLWRRTRPKPDPRATLPIQAMFDSARVTAERGDWAASVLWNAWLERRMPEHSRVKLLLGVVLQNRVMSQQGRAGASFAYSRTSLVRAETKRRSLELMAQAASLATVEQDWILARQSYGETLESMGLPLDAMEAYVDVRRRFPNEPANLRRIVFVRDRLRDPLLPDSAGTPPQPSRIASRNASP